MNEYISREALKKAIDTWDRFYYVPLQGVKRGCNDDYTALVRIDDILHCIDNMPSADVQPVKHGQWESPVSVGNGIKFCSVCRNEAYWDTDYGQQLFDFCPYCGAKMVKDGDTE